jgi:AcrR family transcriptional regulator
MSATGVHRGAERDVGGGTPGVDARIVRTRRDVLGVALDVLLDEGRDALTQPHVASVAGYSRATVYKHWPTRTDMLRDTFAQLGEIQHHTPTGDLRADLIEELTAFRRGMESRRLHRALAVLAELTASVPELVEVRDRLVTDGEHVVRDLLASVLQGTRLEAATLMLSGALLHAALMHGRLPTDAEIAAAVDVALHGVEVRNR